MRFLLDSWTELAQKSSKLYAYLGRVKQDLIWTVGIFPQLEATTTNFNEFPNWSPERETISIFGFVSQALAETGEREGNTSPLV